MTFQAHVHNGRQPYLHVPLLQKLIAHVSTETSTDIIIPTYSLYSQERWFAQR